MHEPLSLEYLGAALKEMNHKVMILDCRIEPNYEAFFQAYKPNISGVTGFANHVSTIKKMVNKVKAINPTTFLIVGGYHATVKPEDFNIKTIDLVVRGKGVTALREIMPRSESQNAIMT